ncbi:MAG: PqiC family protein [Desulfobacterales bacterium]|jgi:uncharacterized lipoprotein YmbA
MMHKGFFLKFALLVILAALILAGCRSSAPPVELYTLNPLSGKQDQANDTESDQTLSIGVGPVEIPEFLDRPQIVTRTGPNKLQVNEFHRWAGRLDENLARVLANNISLLLGTDQVVVYPWTADFKPHYRIALNVRYFEGQLGEGVLLDVIWTVASQERQTTQTTRKSVIKKPLSTTHYEGLVAAQSRAIAELSREIVQEIRNLQSGKN